MWPTNKAAVLGIGSALVDIMTTMNDDNLLSDLKLQKGSMQLVDKEFSAMVLEKAAGLAKQIASGGSAANTIHGIANLGIPTGFIGKVGNDDFGDFFRKDMTDSGIKPMLLPGKDATGRVIALVSPDSERTFATFLGASVEQNPDDLTPAMFAGYGIFHIEGYLVFNHDLMLKALELARSQGLMISLDLASFNVVEANREFLSKIVVEYVDIVFANEEEARAYTGVEPEAAVKELSRYCEIAVVKIGSKGSLVRRGQEEHRIAAIPADCIDTTGAGDLYASGFLYGLVNDYSLDKCGKTGSILAGNVIQILGAKMTDEQWVKIREAVKMI